MRGSLASMGRNGFRSGLIVLILTGLAGSAQAAFTAYNDMLLAPGEPSVNITTNSFLSATSGMLIDHTSGSSVGVTVTLSPSTGASSGLFNNTTNPPPGSDAYLLFNGTVGCSNYQYETTGASNIGPYTIQLTGLDPSATYSFVLFGTRGFNTTQYSDRLTAVTVADVGAFANNSSASATRLTHYQANDTAELAAANTNGAVWRFDNLTSGPDGDMQFEVYGRGTNGQTANIYLGGFMLQGFNATSNGASTVWRQAHVTGTMYAPSCTLYLYTSNSTAPVYIDDVNMCAGSTAEAGTNLVPNPGFESGTNGWDIVGNFIGPSMPVTSCKRSGSDSLLLQASAPVAAGGSSQSIKQAIPGMTSGSVYTLSFWYYATNSVDIVARYSGHPLMADLIQLGSGGTITNVTTIAPFSLTATPLTPGSNILHLAANGLAGKIYRVMRRTSLTGGSWQTYSMLTANVDTVSLDVPTAGADGFFRIVETSLGMPSIDNSTGASSVTPTAATLNGNLHATGGLPTSVFVCWDTSDKGTSSTGVWAHVDNLGIHAAGTFTDPVSGIASNATFYYRCFAANAVGSTFAPAAANFSTLVSATPTLTSPTANPVGSGSATLGAAITSAGSSVITSRGTCYGTSPAPTGNALAEGSTNTGIFTQYRSGLNNGTLYYYRGYAVNAAGTGYSPDGSFWTEPGPATGLGFSSVTANSMSLSWTTNATFAAGCVVIYRDGADMTADPVDGTTYSIGNSIGGGTVALVGGGTTANLTGLTSGHTYYVRVYAFSGSGTAINYQQDTPASGSQTATAAQALGPNAFYQVQTWVYDNADMGWSSIISPAYVFVANAVPGNRAPVISAISATPNSVSPFGTVNLSVTASDPDGDSLKYAWVVTGGQLGITHAATETWRAPSLGGTYRLQVLVGDGKTWTNAFVNVTVNGNGTEGVGQHPAAIYSMVPSKVAVAPGETIQITCTGADRDGDTMGISWNTSGGTLSGSGWTINWTAPSSPSNPASRVHYPDMAVWNRQPPAGTTPACPFPLSTDIVGIGIMGRGANCHFCDTWMPSWGDDGNLYSPWQDGQLLTAPFAGMSCMANAEPAQNGWAQITGNDPQDLMTSKAGVQAATKGSYLARFQGACFMKDNIFYYGTYCVLNEDANGNATSAESPDGNSFTVMGPFIGFRTSLNRGDTWTETTHTPTAPLFNFSPENVWGAKKKLGMLYPVDLGKNQQYSPDGKLYMISNGAKDPDPYPAAMANNGQHTGDQLYMVRVNSTVADVNNSASYEYFAGNDANGNPTWTSNYNSMQPLIDWNNHCGSSTMVYDPGLNKYLVSVTVGHMIRGANGWPTAEDYDQYMLESDHMTGPFKLVHYFSKFGVQAYYPNLPSKFISTDGRTAWWWYGANFNPWSRTSDPFGSGYRMSQQQIRLLSPSDLQ